MPLDSIIVGVSRAICQLRATVALLGDCPDNIVIVGPTGSGKRVVADAIARCAPPGTPFGRLGCARERHSLVASELFGHEKNAFTGAAERRAGILTRCNGGFVFVDDMHDSVAETQGYLVDVTGGEAVRPLGASRDEPLRIQWITGSHEPLEDLVRAGKLRADLSYRLEGITLLVPPLRERPEDLPVLGRHLLALAAKRRGRPVPLVSDEALALLVRYEWPGNVRQFQKVLSAAAFWAWAEGGRGPQVLPRHLPEKLQRLDVRFGRGRPAEVSTALAMATVARLGSCGAAAEALGVSERTVRRQLGQSRAVEQVAGD